MDIYLLLFLIIIVAPISVLIHEGGHLIGALLCKTDYTIISIGRGKKLISLSTKKIELTIHLIFFLNGKIESLRHKPYDEMERILISMSGPLSNIVAVFLFCFIYTYYSSDYILLLILFNGWLAITNIIPYKIHNRFSDGYLILKMMKKKYHKKNAKKTS